MSNTQILIVAMAQRCRRVIHGCEDSNSTLPTPLQPKHLIWMCEQIESHAAVGPATKLHRWIGFVQAAMLAHRMLDLDGLKSMFDEAKREKGSALAEIADLTDHLDPTIAFTLDLGGEA